MASGTVKISEKRMAASKAYRAKGCKVTSVARSGDLHNLRKLPARARVALYSGK